MILNNLAQNPEINDQFSETTPNAIEKTDVTEPGHNSTNPDNNDFNAPMIPLIASAAGMLVPFEPVVTLREKIPVTSYRRAFDRAVDSFMGTFDKYKTVDDIDDPYMTRRFNRRFMNDDSKRKKKNVL
ncbi:hypothetical protein MSG28_015706 [Choristoneura fumiferana]|uniref:Uncharacterized protein n=1 Tax=Choristoneura fumiferana TaxID=7141 RepID=A0ACC0KB28_CHOFU|nr:hypothetical protein MSG28_015706 [Choristoneura fumiferana]